MTPHQLSPVVDPVVDRGGSRSLGETTAINAAVEPLTLQFDFCLLPLLRRWSSWIKEDCSNASDPLISRSRQSLIQTLLKYGDARGKTEHSKIPVANLGVKGRNWSVSR